MPNFPPNYKEQESYYASQEYKDNATMALEQGNKLPTLEDKKAGKSYTPRRLHQKLPPLSYPLKSGPNQRTGDRLVIKCLKFEPPEAGAGATVTPTNLFKKDKEGNVSVYTTADRAKIKQNIKDGKPGGYG